jgi:hypothetical protein
MNLHTDSFARNMASIARKREDDRNIVANATHLIRTLERIIASDAPGDFCGTADGISFLHSVHSMTGM